jgi:hypothetical protein
MIERLQRALEHVEELSPEAQEDIAEQIEELALPVDNLPEPQRPIVDSSLPKSVRDALAVAGIARALQDDDEFEALDRIRHESEPTPPIELDDL